MKKLFIYVLLAFGVFISNAQNREIRNDTIILGSKSIGLIKHDDHGDEKAYIQKHSETAYFKDRASLKQNKSWVKDFHNVIKRCRVDKFILDTLLLFNSNWVTKNGVKIGSYKHIGRYGRAKVVEIKIFYEDLYSESLDFIEYSADEAFGKYAQLWFKLDLSSLKTYRRKLAELEEQQREKHRVQRFLAQTYFKLDGNLDPVEGIYRSVDLGERFEYDIAIFKSAENEREYAGHVITSTDRDLQIGSLLFTFEKTAQKNLFFAKYSTKDGNAFENKTATLDGAVLKMGLKSFIKMYPIGGKKRKYLELNPLVDWEASGSGVLINSSGFIATNNHVIKGAKQIRVAFQNDSLNYEAKIFSQNEVSDVAIIQITDKRFKNALTPVKWNTDITLGQKVFTLGYPLASKMSVNVKVVDGIVSGLNGRDGNQSFFQTTLPVWYGNSGGPCFNSKGEILGLTTQILWDRGGKVDNVAYITKTKNMIDLSESIIKKENRINNNAEEIELEKLLERLIPYSVFIKVNY